MIRQEPVLSGWALFIGMRALPVISFLKMMPDLAASALSTKLMNPFKRILVGLDLRFFSRPSKEPGHFQFESKEPRI